MNYNTAGSYNAHLTVNDIYGNSSEIDLPVTIKELSLKVLKTSIVLKEDGTGKVNVSTNSNYPITSSSSNEKVATVDSGGNIKAVGIG